MEFLNDLLKSPKEQARIAAQKVAWFWNDRNSHKRGAVDSTVSGMQFRTFYEPFWTSSDSSMAPNNTNKVITAKKNETLLKTDTPPSQRIALAIKLLIEFDNVPMIDEGISEDEARSLLEYFRTL